MTRLVERAPAKINLWLHVLGRRPDGWHELESLVAFSRFGDLLSLAPAETLSLVVDGPTAAAAGPEEGNLVIRAARSLASRAPGLRLGEFRLRKSLPAAAGLGGGSSDAAAALRLLARANDLSLGDDRLVEAARSTGADVAVCLDPQARVMTGIGERLGPRVVLPPLFCVLANPRVGLETRAVFAAMGLSPGESRSRRQAAQLGRAAEAGDLLGLLESTNNDMEDAARALCPAVAETLAALRELPDVRLVRMSGSGATCFALFKSRTAASKAAARLRDRRPLWWVRGAVLQ